ncbi:MAG TPA: type II CAAX endopeptidase family protein [Acidobacteriota bacterium]|jgi:membrane protease YdiL (CAAX protease family)
MDHGRDCSSIRNPQSEIRNPQSAIRNRRISLPQKRVTLALLVLFVIIPLLSFVVDRSTSLKSNKALLYGQILVLELALFLLVYLVQRPLGGLGTLGWSLRFRWSDGGYALFCWLGAMILLSFLGIILYRLGLPIRPNIRFLLPRTNQERLVWICISAVAGASEELAYRGFAIRHFPSRSPWVAAAVSSLFFGLSHLYEGTASAILITFYGLIFAAVVLWRGNLRVAILMHAFHDAASGLLGGALTGES